MKKAFTLAEVLITLVIIGIISAITIPQIMLSVHNQEFKTGYKKAYSDISNAAIAGMINKELPYRDKKRDVQTTQEEWNYLKKSFGVQKVCAKNELSNCWVEADTLYGCPSSASDSFIDVSGRAWAILISTENIYVVDINGDKGPNRFGKDRWGFTFANEKNNRICNAGKGDSEGDADPTFDCDNPGEPMSVIPHPVNDYKTKHTSVCNYPPCYYFSWLIN